MKNIKSMLMSGGLIATVLLGTIIPPGQSAYAVLSKDQTIAIIDELRKGPTDKSNDDAQNNGVQGNTGGTQSTSNPDSAKVMDELKESDLKNVDKDYFLNALDLTTAQIWHISGVDERLRFFNGDINQVSTTGANSKRDFAKDSGNASANVMTCLFPSSGGMLNTAGGKSSNLDRDCKPTPKLIASIIGYIYNNVRNGKTKAEAKLENQLKVISDNMKYFQSLKKKFENKDEDANLSTIMKYLNSLKSDKSKSQGLINNDIYDKLDFLSTLMNFRKEAIPPDELINAAVKKCKNKDNIHSYIIEKMKEKVKEKDIDKDIIDKLQLVAEEQTEEQTEERTKKQSKKQIKKQKKQIKEQTEERTKKQTENYEILINKIIPCFAEEFTSYPSTIIQNGELEKSIIKPYVDSVNSLFKEQFSFEEDIILNGGNVNNGYFGQTEDIERALKCVEYLLNNIAGMVQAEGKGIFPKYTTEKVLLDFCICYFDKQEDLYNTIKETLPKIKPKEGSKEGSTGISDEDWKKIDQRIKLLEMIKKNSLIPYNAPLESNKNALVVEERKDNSLAFSTTKFADCAEVAILHIMNLLSYGGEKSILVPAEEDYTQAETDKTAIIKAISNPGEKIDPSVITPTDTTPITPQRIIKAFFHYIYTGQRFDDSSITVRSFWNLIVSNMNSLKKEDGYYNDIKYCKNNGNELEPGYVNMLKVIYNIIYCIKGKDESNKDYNKKIQDAKQAIDDLAKIITKGTNSKDLTNKLKSAIEKAFGLLLSQDGSLSIESGNNLSIKEVKDSNDLFGRVSITLEKGNTRDDNNELKFTIDHSEKHSEVNCNVLEPIVLDDDDSKKDDRAKEDKELSEFIKTDETAQLLSRFFTTKSLRRQVNEGENEQKLLNNSIETNSIFNNLFGNIRLNPEKTKEYEDYIDNTKALKLLDAIEKGYEQGELAEIINKNKEILYSGIKSNIKLNNLKIEDFVTQNYLSRVAGKYGNSSEEFNIKNCGFFVQDLDNNNKTAFVYKKEGDKTVKLFVMAPLYEANKDLDINIPPTIKIGNEEYDVSGVEITNEAFSQCEELKSITFSQDMAELNIGEGAFEDCKNLTEFNVPDHVTNLTIGKAAFFQSGLNKFKIPATAQTGELNIGDYAFKRSKLAEFEISAGAQITELNIGESAFRCYNLTEFKVPASVKKLNIGNEAFSSSGLDKFEFADKVKIEELKIPEGAFRRCSKLESFSVPVRVKKLTIGKKSFEESGLNKFEFPAGAQIYELNMGDAAFCSCKQLKGFNVPVSVTTLTIGKEVFKDGGLNNFEISMEAKIAKIDMVQGSFWGCESLDPEEGGPGLDVPDDVKREADEVAVFDEPEYELENEDQPTTAPSDERSIFITENVGKDTKNGISFTYTIEFAYEVKENGTVKLSVKEVRYRHSRRFDIKIPQTITIGNNTYNVSEIEIMDGAFKQCKKLKRITFPQNITKLNIPEDAFAGCESLKEFNMPGTVTNLNIGNYSFTDCKKLKEFKVPASVKKLTIGKNAFELSELNKFEISAEAQIEELNIGESAFWGCENLTEFKVPDHVQKLNIGSCAFKKSKLNKFEISAGAQIEELNIGESAFWGCENLTEFNVLDRVKKLTIGKRAFAKSGLKKI